MPGALRSVTLASRNMRPLSLHVERIKRLASGHKQAIALTATEAQVGTHLRQQDLANAVAIRGKDVHAIIAFPHPAGSGPEVAIGVSPDTVGQARPYPVEDH